LHVAQGGRNVVLDFLDDLRPALNLLLLSIGRIADKKKSQEERDPGKDSKKRTSAKRIHLGSLSRGPECMRTSGIATQMPACERSRGAPAVKLHISLGLTGRPVMVLW